MPDYPYYGPLPAQSDDDRRQEVANHEHMRRVRALAAQLVVLYDEWAWEWANRENDYDSDRWSSGERI